jgi:Zn-dependent M16 (insulinase) family peptidase
MDPEGRGYVAMARHFSGLTDQMRQAFRDQILAAEPRQIRETLADYFAKVVPEAAVAVYAAQEKLEEANKSLDRPLDIEKLTEV